MDFPQFDHGTPQWRAVALRRLLFACWHVWSRATYQWSRIRFQCAKWSFNSSKKVFCSQTSLLASEIDEWTEGSSCALFQNDSSSTITGTSTHVQEAIVEIPSQSVGQWFSPYVSKGWHSICCDMGCCSMGRCFSGDYCQLLEQVFAQEVMKLVLCVTAH